MLSDTDLGGFHSNIKCRYFLLWPNFVSWGGFQCSIFFICEPILLCVYDFWNLWRKHGLTLMLNWLVLVFMICQKRFVCRATISAELCHSAGLLSTSSVTADEKPQRAERYFCRAQNISIVNHCPPSEGKTTGNSSLEILTCLTKFPFYVDIYSNWENR